MTKTIDNVKELECFINEGIRPVDHRDNEETVAYINANIEIKKLYEENDLTTFISTLQLKERVFDRYDSKRIKIKQGAYQELLAKHHELFY